LPEEPEREQARRLRTPSQRIGELDKMASPAIVLAAEAAPFVNGQTDSSRGLAAAR
jgi:hypothetical protein